MMRALPVFALLAACGDGGDQLQPWLLEDLPPSDGISIRTPDSF